MKTTFKAAALAMLCLVFTGAFAEEHGNEIRLDPKEISSMAHHSAGSGTSGIKGIETTVLSGNPQSAGLYTIKLRVPANTTIQAHSHKDVRSASVVSGTWYIGYGSSFKGSGLKALPPGSFYTEPAGRLHFAQTKGEPVTVYITGYGPTSTDYAQNAADLRKR